MTNERGGIVPTGADIHALPILGSMLTGVLLIAGVYLSGRKRRKSS